MKKDGILLIESFFLPGCRERLYKTFVFIKTKRIEEAAQEIKIQREYLEQLLKRPLDLQGEEDYRQLSKFIEIQYLPLFNRVQTIRMRAGEIALKKEPKDGC